jgi:hypothetical protein
MHLMFKEDLTPLKITTTDHETCSSSGLPKSGAADAGLSCREALTLSVKLTCVTGAVIAGTVVSTVIFLTAGIGLALLIGAARGEEKSGGEDKLGEKPATDAGRDGRGGRGRIPNIKEQASRKFKI